MWYTMREILWCTTNEESVAAWTPSFSCELMSLLVFRFPISITSFAETVKPYRSFFSCVKQKTNSSTLRQKPVILWRNPYFFNTPSTLFNPLSLYSIKLCSLSSFFENGTPENSRNDSKHRFERESSEQ